MAGSREEGDDALQDAMLKAWRAFDRLRDEDAFKPWMLKIIRNTSISRQRRYKFGRMLGLDAAGDVAVDSHIDYGDRELVRMGLGKLPLKQREALILYEVLGMSVSEIAAQQKAGESAVKSRLARGRRRLRDEVSALQPEEKGHEIAYAE